MPDGLLGMLSEFVTGVKDAVFTLQERAVSISNIGNEVWEQFYVQGAWLNDLYVEDGEIFAVASEGGKLFRAAVDVDENGDITLGEMVEVITSFDPVSRMEFSTSDDGKIRMLAVSATSVLNRNGEIDSKNLFDSMSNYMKRTGKKIPRTFTHHGSEFKTGDIIWMGRDENVLLTVTEQANEPRVAAAKKMMKYKNARTPIEAEQRVKGQNPDADEKTSGQYD